MTVQQLLDALEEKTTSKKTLRRKRRCIYTALLLTTGTCMYFFTPPIVSDVKISDMKMIGNEVWFEVSFKKTWPCAFVDLTWYDENHKRKMLSFEDRDKNLPKSRPTGWQAAGPWKIAGMTTHELTHHSYAIARHTCIYLFTIETLFYHRESPIYFR